MFTSTTFPISVLNEIHEYQAIIVIKKCYMLRNPWNLSNIVKWKEQIPRMDDLLLRKSLLEVNHINGWMAHNRRNHHDVDWCWLLLLLFLMEEGVSDMFTKAMVLLIKAVGHAVFVVTRVHFRLRKSTSQTKIHEI